MDIEGDVPNLIAIEDSDVEQEIISVADERKAEASPKKVPVTIITGFLGVLLQYPINSLQGSGKTTLVTSLLNDNTHGKRIAVILNEFGESTGIDKSLTVDKFGNVFEEWLELGNGCLCCSVKDNGVKAIEDLMKKKGKFDYILLETTGLADPAPIASMFWLDEQLQSDLYLDGIITVIDSKYAQTQLSEIKDNGIMNECIQQIALADRLILNKQDLVEVTEVKNLITTIGEINAEAPAYQTSRSKVPIDFILDLHAFDSKSFRQLNPQEKQTSSHLDGSTGTISFSFPNTVILDKVDFWVRQILWEKCLPNIENSLDFEILRMKGIVNVEGSEFKFVLQGVRELYDKQQGVPWEANEERSTRLVFIGKNLNKELIKQSFQISCL